MNSHTHDPREHIRGVHQIFISDKKRIGFLFGAGTSFGTGVKEVSVPAVSTMTEKTVQEVGKASAKFKTALDAISKEIEEKAKADGERFNVESLLSAIETKIDAVGEGNLNGLKLADLLEMRTAIKKSIRSLVSVHETLSDAHLKQLAHCRLASWISKARRTFPVEVFTTNYDYLFELAFEHFGIPYFDAFAGGYEPFFCPEAVEDIRAYPQLVKLWKVHGSLGWRRRKRDGAVIRDKATNDEELLIFPSYLKYSNSKKQPYVALIDRLCGFLQQDDAVLITCGYSFGDRHINERIATSLRRGDNAHVIALCYDQYMDGKGKPAFALADERNPIRAMATHETSGKMSAYGTRHAVIGGRFGEWKLRDEPNANDSMSISGYFDEDASLPGPGKKEEKGTETWSGTGKCTLPEFSRLTEFLEGLAMASSGGIRDR